METTNLTPIERRRMSRLANLPGWRSSGHTMIVIWAGRRLTKIRSIPVVVILLNLPWHQPHRLQVDCFSGEMVVDVKGKGSTKMSRLQLGDEVLVSSSGAVVSFYEAVYSFGHRHESIVADYLQLLPSKLELSPDHMVFVLQGSSSNKDCVASIPASMVKVGDILSGGDRRPVSAIRHVKRKGAYAPFTASGTLIVNGARASSFVSLQEGTPFFMVGSWKTPLTWQWLAHTFEAPHRVACQYSLTYWCYANESYTPDGISTWVAKPLELTQWFLQDHHSVVLLLAILPLTAALAMVSLLEAAFYYPGVLVTLFITILFARRRRLVVKVVKL